MKKTETPKDIQDLLDQAKDLRQSLEDYEGMNLEDCLRLFSREDLVEMVRANGYAVKTSLKKAELIEKLAVEINKRYRLYIDNMPLEEFYCLNTCMSNNELDFTEELYVIGMPFFAQGFLFFLESDSGQDWKLIFPKEFMILLLDETTEENLELYVKRQLLCMVMRGLSSIYGVYPKEQLENVWKHILREEKELLAEIEGQTGDELDQFDALFNWDSIEAVINSCIIFSQIGHTGFEFFAGYIMVDGLSEERYYADILKASQGKVYYLPPLSEIMYYAENEFDIDSKPYLQLKEYFSKTDLDADEIEELMDELCSIYTEDSGIRLAMEAIDEAGVVFDSEKEIDAFLPMLSDLSNCTRKWVNKGYTPNELAAQNVAIPLRKPPVNNVIPFPTHRIKK